MNSFKQSAIPRQRLAEKLNLKAMEPDGFVDDEVVLALIAGPSRSRATADSKDLVLAADDMDFAGWIMPEPLPSRFTPPIVSETEIHERRAEPPTWNKAPAPRRKQAAGRWLLAGLIGTIFTLSLAALLFALVDRGLLSLEGFSFPAKQEVPQTAPLKSTPEAAASSLTDPKSRP